MSIKTTIDRQTFLKTCGAACLSTAGLSLLLSSCKTVYYAQAPVLTGKTIQVSKQEFDIVSKKGEVSKRTFMLVETKGQSFPIYLYHAPGSDEYSAVLMKCTHQGNELNAHDGYLTCPAHGSEYDKNGKVTEGPAEKNLTAFRVSSDQQNVYIHLT